ncbi:NUDIX hydrolase [Aeromicrobium piscarium]|uniref:NUDIX hydrolase n=1 Tax=Aeromicrobium piscarium TaxID=2590901 RepID=A0A554S7P9_9ACTN|nr:NUDIX domain-containing protein [Aeromicrobium piscarium]TSD62378.1 NUDIX hydrolase [Aeromicrobium piscarium]
MSRDQLFSPMPAQLIDHARTFDGNAVAPRDAATVALVRFDDRQIFTYLLQRVSTMTFASGFSVFPGGGVGDQDWDPDLPFAAGIDQIARAFGCDPHEARAVVAAAVRETFEETGVLLADPVDASSAMDETALELDRIRLIDGTSGLTDILERHGYAIQPGLLRPWGRWITPDFEPRRYDARFFVARVPHGQRVRHVSTEAETSAWVELEDAVMAAERGDIRLLPPTLTTCRELVERFRDGTLMAQVDRRVPVRTGRAVEIEGELFIEHLVRS